MKFKEFINENNNLDLLLEDEQLDESVKSVLKNIKAIGPQTKKIIKTVSKKTNISSVEDFRKHVTNILVVLGNQFRIPKGEVVTYTNKITNAINRFDKKDQSNLSTVSMIVGNSKVLNFFERFLVSIGMVLTFPGGFNVASIVVLFLEIIIILSIFIVTFCLTVGDKL